MASLQDLQSQQPTLYKLGLFLIRKNPKMLMATLSKDGSPRVSPICPVFAHELIVTVIGGSIKLRDIETDNRVALHAIPGPGDEEFKISGRLVRADDAKVNEWRAQPSPLVRAPDGDAVFTLDITLASGAVYHQGPTGLPVADRRTWKPTPQGEPIK